MSNRITQGPCIVCGSLSVRLNRALNLTQCGRCGFIWQYSTNGSVPYDLAYLNKYRSYPVDKLSQLRADFVESVAGANGNSSILDIGYGLGGFLKEMRRRGHPAYGLEVNPFAIGKNPEITDVEQDNWPEVKCVTFFDSLEHLKLLVIGAYLIAAVTVAPLICVSTPNVGERGILSLNEWRHYRIDEHYSYFNEATLTLLFARLGYRKIASSFFEDAVRKAPWKHNILTCVFRRRVGVL